MAKNAPGKHYRKGISYREILREKFPNEEAAKEWFFQVMWGGELHCPACGSENINDKAKHKTTPFRCREKECGKRFSLKTGTIMEASNISYDDWAIALYLFLTNLKGISSLKLHRELEITQKTAWFMLHRIRKSFSTGKIRLRFAGPVEVDETFIGGKVKNMSNSKRKEFVKKYAGGRGSVGKAIVIGIKDRKTKQVQMQVIPDRTKPTMQNFIVETTKEGAIVFTDEARGYRGLEKETGRQHKAVKHKEKKFVDGMAHTNGIESVWSMVKRGYEGVYHHMSEEHLDKYINEFQGRQNVREKDTIKQMETLSKSMPGKRLKYKNLIADGYWAKKRKEKELTASPK